MAANMTNEIASVDKLPEYIEEARKMGISIDPPDINRSGPYFTVVEGRIVYGLVGIKGLGTASVEEIVNCRADGPYKDFIDFLDKVNIKTVGKKVVELLIQTGAFDAFGVSRATLAGNLERAVDYAQTKKEGKLFGQSSLFEDTGVQEYPEFVFESQPEWDRAEQLRIEKGLLGFYFTGHPMDQFRDLWKRVSSLDLSAPDQAAGGQEYVILGVLKSLKPIQTKKGKPMCFGSLADYNGEVDLTFFTEIWEKNRDTLVIDSIIALRGKLDKSRGTPSFVVDEILELAKLAESNRELHIRLREAAAKQEEALYPLRDYLMENNGPCPVFIHVPVSGGEAVIRASSQISAGTDAAYINALSLCAEVAGVWVA
jgi:DNA polymerase-3 subunit alpha